VVHGALLESRGGEVIIERTDGSRVTVIVNIRPLKNQDGEITGAINCFYDISERKRAEEALPPSAPRNTEFLAMLAHQVRNPLAPIQVAIDILRRAREGDGSDQRRGQTSDHALDVLQG